MIHVVAAVIERTNRFLICQRPLHKQHGGLWEFPGGKVDAGESHEQALVRELWEELQVRAVSSRFAHKVLSDSNSTALAIHFYRVEITGEPQLLEHQALAWCTLSELTTKTLAPADARFVQDYLGSHLSPALTTPAASASPVPPPSRPRG